MMDVVCSWWCQRKRGSKKGRQDVKGGKSRMREPISSELPSSLPKGSSLKTWRKNTSRTWKETNWGAPRSSSTKKGLSQACSRVRTAGDRGAPVWLSPWQIHSWQRAWPPGSPSAGSSQHPGHLAQGSSAQAISWLLTDTGHFHSLWFPQLLRDLVSSPFHSPPSEWPLQQEAGLTLLE